MPPVIAELIVVLVKTSPGYLTLDRLHAKLYGSFGKPTADATIRAHLSRTSKFLQQIGFRVENVRALGWRIVRDEAAKLPVPFESYAAVVAERDAALDLLERLKAEGWSANLVDELAVLRPKVVDIIRATATRYRLSVGDILCSSRNRRIVHPRQEVMYRAAMETLLSYPQIGRALGNRDQTTIRRGVIQHAKRNGLPLPRGLQLGGAV